MKQQETKKRGEEEKGEEIWKQ